MEGIWPWVWRLGPLVILLTGGWLALRYSTHMPGRSYAGPLEALTAEQAAMRDELRAHVSKLAGEIGERSLMQYAKLTAAADYLRATLEQMGYVVREQSYSIEGSQVSNVEAELRGTSRPDEIVVVGAHYDSVFGTVGANDNASGVAALLVLARWARGQQFARTVRFVAFVNEEPPWFQSGQMGSQVYAKEARKRGDKIVAMLSLETIGYYSDRKGSQQYPFPFGFMYPDTGNFIALVGNVRSRELVHRAISAFRQHAKFPSEGAAAPGFIPGIGWSDHWSFWEEGYAGVMVTDTALYRYPYYHTTSDTPDKLDYERMARVVAGLARVVEELARGAEQD